MLRTIKGNNNGTTKTFFRAFKQNFLQSLLVSLLLTATAFVLFTNIRFLQHSASPMGKPLFYVSLGIAGLFIILALYIFPVIAAFANTTLNLIKNAFVFAFMHFPSTLVIAVVSILPMYMTYQDLKLMPLYACCWFFFGFALTALINSSLLYRMFKPFLEKAEEAEKPTAITTTDGRITAFTPRAIPPTETSPTPRRMPIIPPQADKIADSVRN